jgi:hypothetical protein
MQDNFDLKKFLIENKLTPASQMDEMGAEPMMLQVGDQITPDMLKNPSQFDFPMEIASFSNDGNEDTVRVKRMVKSKGMFGGRESEDAFEDLVSNWERIHLKPNVRMSAQTEMDFDNQMNEMNAKPMMLQVGDQITPNMLKNPSDFDFPMKIVSFSNDGDEDTVRVKRILKKKGMLGHGKEVEDTFEDLISNWERIYLKPNVRMSAQTEMDFDNSMDEYFSFDNKSPEGQRIKNKPQDVLNRRGQGQITPDNKDIYKKVVGKKGDVGKAYGNVGPKGSLPENGSAFSKY